MSKQDDVFTLLRNPQGERLLKELIKEVKFFAHNHAEMTPYELGIRDGKRELVSLILRKVYKQRINNPSVQLDLFTSINGDF